MHIIHFNDVYKIEPHPVDVSLFKNKNEINKNNSVDAAKFKTFIESKRTENTLVIFSGDAFSPSLLSSVYKGEQMVEILNNLGINFACIGNHEFDFGTQKMIDLLAKSNFQWAMSNILFKKHTNFPKEQKKILRNTFGKYLVEETKFGNIGFIFLGGKQWFLEHVDNDLFEYLDHNRLCEIYTLILKSQYKCKYIIFVTHMEMADDKYLLTTNPFVDLILGGHNHVIYTKRHGEKYLFKSGYDFNIATEIILDENFKNLQYKRYNISEFSQDKPMMIIIDKYIKNLKQTHTIAYAYVNMPNENIRKEETLLGEYISDVFKILMDSDVVYINAGAIRSSISRGKISWTNILELLPFNMDKMINVKISVKMLIDALEYSLTVPHLFPCLSGITFNIYNGIIDRNSVRINGHKIDFDEKIIVSIPDIFLKSSFITSLIISPENILTSIDEQLSMTLLLLKYFDVVNILKIICLGDNKSIKSALSLYKKYKKYPIDHDNECNIDNLKNINNLIEKHKLHLLFGLNKSTVVRIYNDIINNRHGKFGIYHEFKTNISIDSDKSN